ncbi:MAG: hypothetical protein ACI8X5_002071 [Planctomycetota bacterium]|jgi:hypothetical protein
MDAIQFRLRESRGPSRPPELKPLRSLQLALVLIIAAALPPEAKGQAQQVDRQALDHFENRVRPLFAEKCVRCHGAKKQKGGLRLDNPAAIHLGGEGGAIVVPGDLEGSRLIQAVHYLDEDLQMPPRSKLDDASIVDLERWVKAGAHLPESHAPTARVEQFDFQERMKHWSFQPLATPEVPTVSNTAWPKSDLDRFLLASLEAADLEPAEDAQASDWLRRVNFALVGLPPTPAEQRAFAADSSQTARAALVDRLLDSPQYGERWARHWLDLVRYAETRGHEFDFPIPNAWQYRDYVVRAFNADVPYDRFLREHVAGDLLPTPRANLESGFDESLLGTAFWFFGDGVHSPVDIRADETDRVANQVDVFSRAFLGLTVACARCHDHKFDPLSARDYYAISGFVMGGSYRQARFETLAREESLASDLHELQERHSALLQAALGPALQQSAEGAALYMEAAREFVNAPLSAVEDSIDSPSAPPISVTAEERGLSVQRLQAWVDAWQAAQSQATHPLHANLQQQVPSREVADDSSNSDAALAALFEKRGDERVLLQDGHTAGRSALPMGTLILGSDPEHAVSGLLAHSAVHFGKVWQRLVEDPDNQSEPSDAMGILPGRMFRTPTFGLSGERLSVLVRGQGFVYAAVDSHRLVKGPLHAALCRKVDTGGVFRWIEIDLDAYKGHRTHLEFSPRSDAQVTFAVAGYVQGGGSGIEPFSIDFSGASSRVFGDAVAAHSDRSSVDWMLQNPGLFPLENESYQRASAQYVRELEELCAGHEWSSHTAPVMLEGSGIDEMLLLRGNAGTPGAVVPRRFLTALGGENDDPIQMGSGRLALAQRLTDEQNPFVARVWANRIWHYLFDQGLVASVDDFGAMGEAPSHPELLDFLARKLMQDGWSTKAMVKRLVLSRAFGMSSRENPRASERDPENRLLHRMPVQRLDAESLRDAILAVSGSLDDSLGGPSVPLYLTAFHEGRGKPSQSGPLDGAGRRSLYLSVRRNFPVPFLGVFDFPNPATTMGRRGNSNVPAQSLTLLNDPFVQGEARRWSQSLLEDSPADTPEERLMHLYIKALGRHPNADESRMAIEFIEQQTSAGGTSLEAWTALCHVLYNTKEFRYLR